MALTFLGKRGVAIDWSWVACLLQTSCRPEIAQRARWEGDACSLERPATASTTTFYVSLFHSPHRPNVLDCFPRRPYGRLTRR